ncbi:MAG: hypothetical protein GC190_20225 [Alphaproteobacteria bacterium]|nr:hypothetical protein [Alphaproteobacteria bacterium]
MRNLPWRATLAIMCLALVPSSEVFAAGKSLKQTLGFIRDRFAGQGEISYTIKLHDSADGSDWSQSMTGRATHVTYDVANCALTYHWNTSSDGKEVQDFDVTWHFKDGRKVGVQSREEEIRTQAIKGGHSTWTAIVSPAVWVVTLTFEDHSGVANFTSKDTAERFARAAKHAMDLCGADTESF